MTARTLCLLGLLVAPLAAQLLEPPALPTAARSIELEPNADVEQATGAALETLRSA